MSAGWDDSPGSHGDVSMGFHVAACTPDLQPESCWFYLKSMTSAADEEKRVHRSAQHTGAEPTGSV